MAATIVSVASAMAETSQVEAWRDEQKSPLLQASGFSRGSLTRVPFTHREHNPPDMYTLHPTAKVRFSLHTIDRRDARMKNRQTSSL